VAILKLYQTHY